MSTDDKQLAHVDEQTRIRQSFDLQTFETMKAIAVKMHGAECFSGNIQSAEQAFVIIQAGYEMGIAPVEALNSFYIVKGKITIYGVALAKRVKMHGWKIKTGKHDEKECELTVYKDEESHSYTAKKEQVENLGAGKGKNAYHNAPEDKLYWHAMSRIVRRYIPEVLGSVAYTHEEIQEAKIFRPEAIEVLSEEEVKTIYEGLENIVGKLKNQKEYEECKHRLQGELEKLPAEQQSMLLATLAEKLTEFKPKKKEEKVDQETGEVKDEKPKEQQRFAEEDPIPDDVE